MAHSQAALAVAGGADRRRHRPLEDALARLRSLGVTGAVIVRIGGKPASPHSALLRKALVSPGSSYRLAAALPHRNRFGLTSSSGRAGEVNAPAIHGAQSAVKAGAVLR